MTNKLVLVSGEELTNDRLRLEALKFRVRYSRDHPYFKMDAKPEPSFVMRVRDAMLIHVDAVYEGGELAHYLYLA